MAIENLSEPITIGAIIGFSGTKATDWRRSIASFSKTASAAEVQKIQSPLNVRFVFILPGPYLEKTFDGVRKKSYSKKNNYVAIEMMVPEDANGDPTEILVDLLQRGLDVAVNFAREKNICSDLPEIRHAISYIIAQRENSHK